MTLAIRLQMTGGARMQSRRSYYLKLSGLSFTTTEELDAEGESLPRLGDGELTTSVSVPICSTDSRTD